MRNPPLSGPGSRMSAAQERPEGGLDTQGRSALLLAGDKGPLAPLTGPTGTAGCSQRRRPPGPDCQGGPYTDLGLRHRAPFLPQVSTASVVGARGARAPPQGSPFPHPGGLRTGVSPHTCPQNVPSDGHPGGWIPQRSLSPEGAGRERGSWGSLGGALASWLPLGRLESQDLQAAGHCPHMGDPCPFPAEKGWARPLGSASGAHAWDTRAHLPPGTPFIGA